MPVPVTQASLPLLYRAGLRKDFRDEWQQHMDNYSMFLKVASTNEPEISAALMTGPSRFLEMGDGEAPVYDDLKMSDRVSAVDKEFGRGFAVTRRTQEDDKYNKARSGAKWLAHAARMTIEYRSASLLDDFFTGSTYTGYDNLSFGNAAHPYLNAAGTFSNVITTELSITGFTAMANIFMTMKDHNGDPIVMTPDKLFIGNSAEQLHRAIQIIQSEKEPFTAENQDNAIAKRFRTMTPVPLVYTQSANKYYMCDSKYNDFHFLMRRAPRLDDNVDFRSGAFQFQSTMRFLIWGVDWRGWAGANVT